MKKLFFLLTAFPLVLSCSSDETSTPVTPPPAPIVKYTITLSAGEGGTVSTTGGEFEAGQTVSVTATPQGEYLFKDWSDGNTNATRTITVSSNSTLTANFEKRKYPLTVNFEGEGEVIEEIVNAGRTTEYDSGTTVKLTAQAAAEWVFVGWTGDIESSEESVQIVIGEPKEVTATFEKKKYPLSVNIEGEGEVIEEIVEADRTTDYDSGTTVKLTAEPADEWLFTGWSGDIGEIDPTENPIQLSIIESKTVTATFEKKKYPLTVNIEGEGEVLEEIVNTGKTIDYDSGTTVKLTAVPAEGWEFVGWTGDIESTDSIIEIEISKAKSVEAKFMRYFNYNKPSYYLETPEDIWIDYYDLLMEKNGYDMGKYAVGYPEVYADFDFDGYVDVIFAPSLYENQGGYGDIELWFFKNTGNNIDFTQEKLSIDPHLGTFSAAQAILGDFNGDNKPDVVYSEAGRDIYLGPGTTPTMLLSTQDGYLMKDITNTSVSYGGGASGDIDNDGDLDVILGGLDALTIFYNDGNGNFEEKIQYADEALNLNPVNDIIELVEIENPSGGSFLNLQLIDINNDGFIDMIGGYDKFRRINTIYYGNGVDFSKDRITVLPYTKEWDALHNINFYDIDGDGELEIIAGRSTGNGFEGFYLEAYKKVGDEYVILENIFDNSSARDIRWIMQMSISDIDNNGKIDIYCRDKGHLGYGEYRWEWNGIRFEKRF